MAPSRVTPSSTGKPQAAGVGWRWRWRLRRLGRQDGRQRHPDPEIAEPPVRTATRLHLEAEMRYQVEVTWSAYAKRVSEKLVEAQSVASTVPLISMRVADAEEQLIRVQKDEPDVTEEVQRFGGEEETPDGVLRRRRFREFERRRNAAAGAHLAALADLRAAQESVTRLEAEAAELSREAIDAARRIAALYESAHEIYQQALLKRHAERELVRLLLDPAPFRLPAVVSEPMYSRHEGQGGR
ncbi:hypothetical protein AB0C07_26230 [Actinoplanes missouriensis]|uniref:hypothetical protein n=1 Tax=Actinoplanes missouriensis TaxID=1866 RepID=UPI0033DF37E6